MHRAITIVATAATLCVCTAGQNESLSAIDPFIGTVEAMKHSVAVVACVYVNGTESDFLTRMGTAFFISTAGEFMTAAHVLLDMQKKAPKCPLSAVILPHNNMWDPNALNEPVEWFAFKIDTCVLEKDFDVAKCQLTDDPFNQTVELKFKIVPAKFDWRIPPDGTQVAFTGFPMNVRDPMTFRANVAAYRPVWRDEKAVAELLLDRAAWPGSSGSPVFLSNGRIIRILIASRTEEGMAITAVRPLSAVRELVRDPKRR